MPGHGVVNENLWDKAKKQVDKKDYSDDDSYWAVVSTVYKNMGGTYKKDTQSKYNNISQIFYKYGITDDEEESELYAFTLPDVATPVFVKDWIDKIVRPGLTSYYKTLRSPDALIQPMEQYLDYIITSYEKLYNSTKGK